MTELLEKAIAKLRQLSSDRQDEAAELLLDLVDREADSPHLSREQVEEVERRIKEPSEYAFHEEVSAFFRKPAR